MALCALWVLLFALMVQGQGGLGRGTGEIYHGIAERFGDLTVRAVADGQVWRTVSSTFVHFSLIHLGINLFGLYQLGLVLESWYGSGQFLAIYVFIALAGNGLAVASKWLLASWFPVVAAFQDNPCGGGSTVLCGLIALLAVVGWRSRTRPGHIVGVEMAGILIFTALMGLALWSKIDNFGHAGGAVAGAVVGFFHRGLLRNFDRPGRRRLAGLLAFSALMVVGGAQFQAGGTGHRTLAAQGGQAAARRRIASAILNLERLARIANLYGALVQRHPGMWRRIDPLRIDPVRGIPAGPDAAALRQQLRATLAEFEAQPDPPGHDPAHPESRSLGPHIRTVCERLPAPGELAAFRKCLQFLLYREEARLFRAGEEPHAR